jgi:hypothetical protein
MSNGLAAFDDAVVSTTTVSDGLHANRIMNNKSKFSSEGNVLIINKTILKNNQSEVKADKEIGGVFITKDQNLLNQYYELREKLFREVDTIYKKKHPEHKDMVVEYDGSETDADRFGSIIVVTDTLGRVVGGMRFLLSDFIEHSLNEEREKGFTIQNFLNDVGLNPNSRFSEASAVVIKRGYRNRSVMQRMFNLLFESSIDMGCDYVVGIAIAAACRDHRIATKSLGYRLDIMMKYPWIRQKEHGYEQRYPVVVYLHSKKQLRTNNK